MSQTSRYFFPILVLCLSLSLPNANERPLATADLVVQAAFEVAKERSNRRVSSRSQSPLPSSASESRSLNQLLDDERKAQALKSLWGVEVSKEVLEAEVVRIFKSTRDVEGLRRLLRATANDVDMFAFTVARPALLDRLIRERFSRDHRIHNESRDRAVTAIDQGSFQSTSSVADATFDVSWVRSQQASRRPQSVSLDQEAFEGQLRRVGGWIGVGAEHNRDRRQSHSGNPFERGMVSSLMESDEYWFIASVEELGSARIDVRMATWRKLSFDEWWSQERVRFTSSRIHIATSFEALAGVSKAISTESAFGAACDLDSWDSIEPAARSFFSSVWTGSEMIVWGGYDGAYLGTGAIYDPATNAWREISTTGAPTPRSDHQAVWTGTEMLIWGGWNGTSLGDGARYDPASDSWIPITATGAPVSRRFHTMVWTGSRALVWGGADSQALDDGSSYDPASDTWLSISTSNAPAPRRHHTAVWSGSEMIVWGGYDGASDLDNGARYEPVGDVWSPIAQANAPSPRSFHTAVWSGSEMVIWGGDDSSTFFATGSRFDPVADSWADLPPAPIAGRSDHTAVWTDTEMLIWGGYDGQPLGDGAKYQVGSDMWASLPISGSPEPRDDHRAVWTGTEMMVWGGDRLGVYKADGGAFDPSTDTWRSTGIEARSRHKSAWTGNEVIVWGGVDRNEIPTASGSRYEPATSTSLELPMTSAPTARFGHVAGWTGHEFLVWGGTDQQSALSSGARYDPLSDSWSEIASQGAPSPRYDHTGTWTGDTFLVWGGTDGTTEHLTGGRYDVTTDTWTPTSETNAPTRRSKHTAVWSGQELIIWGGQILPNRLNSGGRYNLQTDSWSTTSEVDAPEDRIDHTAVWADDRMLVWGGEGVFGALATGAAYDPATDTWSVMSSDDAPDPRFGHAAVWTGCELILWGGTGLGGSSLSSGAVYDTATDAWGGTSQIRAPTARTGHTAEWLGSNLLVTGGRTATEVLSSQAAYCSLTSTLGFEDGDSDLFGDPSRYRFFCGTGVPAGWSTSLDCNDTLSTVYPGAPQECDLLNNDCDDPAWPSLNGTNDFDDDGDTFTECTGDCDDTSGLIYPSAPQVCDGINNDCSSPGWPSITNTNEKDDDADGVTECGGDCDDTRQEVLPGGSQVCDGVNNDCLDPLWPSLPTEEVDDDGDGFAECDGECNDADRTIFPGAGEICTDGSDNDCNSLADDQDPVCPGLEVAGLGWGPASKSTLQWDEATSASSYLLYKGWIEGAFDYSHRCEATELGTNQAIVDELPEPGSAHYFLTAGAVIDAVTRRFSVGALGQSSDSLNRPEGAVSCGPRVYVDPDAIGSQNGLSWPDAYTSVGDALRHGFAEPRGLEVWIKGTHQAVRRLNATIRTGFRLLGGFAGTEILQSERLPETNATTLVGNGVFPILESSGVSVAMDGLTFENAPGLSAFLDSNLLELRSSTIRQMSRDALDVVATGDSVVRIDESTFEQLSNRGIALDLSSGQLDGAISRSTVSGAGVGIDFAAGTGAGDAQLSVDIRGCRIVGGDTGIRMLATVEERPDIVSIDSTVSSNVVAGTHDFGILLESKGRYFDTAQSSSVTVSPAIVFNTIDDVSGSGVACLATKEDTTRDPTRHEVQCRAELWNNLLTNCGVAIEESTDGNSDAWSSNPQIIGNGLFGSSVFLLDGGVLPVSTLSDLNNLGQASSNSDVDPQYTDASARNYSLQPTSGVIDLAEPGWPGIVRTDIDGDNRVILKLGTRSGADLGSDEVP